MLLMRMDAFCCLSLLKFYTIFSGLKPPNIYRCSLVVFIPEKVGGKNNTKNSWLNLRILGEFIPKFLVVKYTHMRPLI
jgi:hypothetical protein